MIPVNPEKVQTNSSSLQSLRDKGRVYPGFSGKFFKSILLSLLFFLFLLPEVAGQWLDGYCYRKEITIQESQIPDGPDFLEFPMLINIPLDADLADEGNGGLVNDSNGWDLVFTDSDGETLLDYDREHYDPSTGEFIAWVKIPILDRNNNTTIYLYFGYDTPAVDPTSVNTWSNAFVSV